MLAVEEFPNPDSHLHGVYTGIQGREARIGDVHVPGFDAPVVGVAQKVDAERRSIGKVHGIRSRGNVVIAKECAAVQFKIRSHAAARRQQPLQSQWTEACSVGRAAGLEHHKYRSSIQHILKPSL